MEDRKLNEKERKLGAYHSNDSEHTSEIWMPVVEICFYCGGMFVCC